MKKIVLVLIISLLLSCKGLKVVTYQKPMTNLELARYIRLIDFKRQLTIQNYLYIYNTQRNFDRLRNLNNNNFYNNYNSYYRNKQNNNTPQTGTTGNTLTTINVLPPVSNGNIKTKQ